ncbi:MAG: hypothetical protein AB7U85_01010 [Alphaproteobacteria bacterium]
MRISSDNYPNFISSSSYDDAATQTTYQKRLELLSTPSNPETTTEETSGFGFRDLIDIVNPLQHIPVISSVYRKVTGDEIGTVARIAGGGLYGGALGAFVGAAESALKTVSGKDMGEHAIAMATYNQDHNNANNEQTYAQKEDLYSSYDRVTLNKNDKGYQAMLYALNEQQNQSNYKNTDTFDANNEIQTASNDGLFESNSYDYSDKIGTTNDIYDAYRKSHISQNNINEKDASPEITTDTIYTIPTAYNTSNPKNNDKSSDTVDETSEEKSKLFSLAKEEKTFAIENNKEKTFALDQKIKDKVFDFNKQKQLNKIYMPQAMALNVKENTLEAAKTSHLNKNSSQEAIDFWSKSGNTAVSGNNAFIASQNKSDI